MTDDLERRLREAFEAKATSVTPDMLDTERERELAAELADTRHGPRRWMAGGLAAAAAVAAAIGIGFVLSDQQAPIHEPVVAASAHHSQATAPDGPSSPSSTPLPQQSKQAAPPGNSQAQLKTSSSEESTQSTPDSTAPAGPGMSQDNSTPSLSSSESTPSSVDGNYYLRGDLRTAAGTAYLPLPTNIPTYIQSETGRTTILSTASGSGPKRDAQADCTGISNYWQQVMPSDGWTRSADTTTKWIAPSGNAWAFLTTGSSGCTIQISAGP